VTIVGSGIESDKRIFLYFFTILIIVLFIFFVFVFIVSCCFMIGSQLFSATGVIDLQCLMVVYFFFTLCFRKRINLEGGYCGDFQQTVSNFDV